MRKLIIFVASVLFSMGFIIQPFSIHAEENLNLKEDPGQYVFSMNEVHQEQRYCDQDGNIVIVTVDTIPVLTRTISSGVKYIRHHTINEDVSYYISVASGTITSAYDGQYNIFGYSVNQSILSVDSSTTASYTLYCSSFLTSFTKILSSEINGDSINVSFH